MTNSRSQARLLEEGAVLSNTARQALAPTTQLNPICTCVSCEGDDHDEAVADP